MGWGQATYAVDGGHDIARRRMEVYTELQTASEPQWRVHVFHFTGWKPWDQPERGGVYVDDAGQVRVCVCVCACVYVRACVPLHPSSPHTLVRLLPCPSAVCISQR